MNDRIRVIDDSGDAGEPRVKIEAGFGNKKRVLVLVLVMVVAGGIGAYQFLRAKGPSEAAAATAAAPAMSVPGIAPQDVEAILSQLDANPKDAAKGLLSVDGVETLVKKFDTYVQERQVPLTGLRVNPFEVPQTVALAAAQPGALASSAQAGSSPEPPANAQKKRVQGMVNRLSLGSVMIVGDRGMAVINGKLCEAGDSIEGFQVEVIEPERVILAREGERVELDLHVRKIGPEGA